MTRRFLDYVNARAENEIKDWINSLPQEAQFKIDTRILRLGACDGSWPPQYVSALKGYAGICELRVVASGVQYRPLGFYGPGPSEFTILIGAVEKGNKLLPKGVLEIALRRRKEVLADRSRVHEHEFS